MGERQWRWRQLTWATLISLVLFGVEIQWLDLYHEEPRRLLVALSMLKEGYWFVPHILGEMYLKKPPAFNWMVALLSLPGGQVTPFTARSVAVMSWLGLGGLVALVSSFLDSKTARYASVFATLFSVTIFIEKAALAELDLFFSFLLTAGVLGWYMLRWRNHSDWAWIISHLFLAVALLTKGPVAYGFFYLPILLLCWWEEEPVRWSGLAAGFALAHAIVGFWLWMVFQKVEPSYFIELTFSEAVSRGSWNPGGYVLQLITFPIVVFLSMAPWTFLFGALYKKHIRQAYFRELFSSRAGRIALCGMSPLVGVWISHAHRVRYVLPVFPMVAIGLGLLVQELEKRGRLKLVLTGISRVLGTVLVLMLALPWILENKQEFISFQVLLIGSVLLAVCGMGVLLVSLDRWFSVKTGFFIMIVFVLLVKAGYLCMYVPAEEPARLMTEKAVAQFADSIDEYRSEPIAYRGDHFLELPLYLVQHGFIVRKNTSSESDRNYKYLLQPRKMDDTRVVDKFRRPGGEIYYLLSRK